MICRLCKKEQNSSHPVDDLCSECLETVYFRLKGLVIDILASDEGLGKKIIHEALRESQNWQYGLDPSDFTEEELNEMPKLSGGP